MFKPVIRIIKMKFERITKSKAPKKKEANK